MADCHVSVQRLQTGFGEHLRDQAHVLVDHDVRAITHRNTRRLLTSVLQRIQAEVGELGNFLTGGPDPENPARILGSLFPWKDLVG